MWALTHHVLGENAHLVDLMTVIHSRFAKARTAHLEKQLEIDNARSEGYQHELAAATARNKTLVRQLNAARATIHDLEATIAAYELRHVQLLEHSRNVVRELDKVFRRPWRPLRNSVSYYTLKFFSFAVRPFSKQTAARLIRSAEKRNPRRFARLPDITGPSRLADRPPVVQLGQPGDEDYRPQEKAVSLKPIAAIVDSVYPRPDSDSGSVDAINLIHALLRMGYGVVFFPTLGAEDAERRLSLEALGVSCPGVGHDAIMEFLRTRGETLDILFLSRVFDGGLFIDVARQTCPRAKIIFNTVDLHFLREEREARLINNRAAIHRSTGTKEREYATVRASDATIVVSYSEEKLLNNDLPGSLIFTLPLARGAVPPQAGFSSRRQIGFIGGYSHPPNVDAVVYFLDEIWPALRVKLPDAEFVAMGADMPAVLRERRDPGFVPMGHVEDLATAFSTIRVMVAPLRVGAAPREKLHRRWRMAFRALLARSPRREWASSIESTS